jgi:2-methylisocitrate lyase-like PEP mutase family enzyme
MTRPTTALRTLLARDDATMAAGAFNPMVAKLAEQAGFDLVYMPGGGIALNRLGVADVGLITLTEMADSARAIADAVSVPVIADADTGFGNQLNVQRTVREFERAGIAGIHIEDQVFPKKCGHFEGKRVIPLFEAAQKIRAAVDARTDPDFVIIARCDALGMGMDEVVRRCDAYREAGADVLFIDAPRSMEDVKAIAARIPGPLLYNSSAGGKIPPLTVEEVGALGYKLMIAPNFSALAAIKAIREVFAEMRASGSVAGVIERCASFKEFTALGGVEAFNEIERRFAAVDEAEG